MGLRDHATMKWTKDELRTDFTDEEILELKKRVRIVHGPSERELIRLIESGECQYEIDFPEGSFYAFKKAVEEGKYDD